MSLDELIACAVAVIGAAALGRLTAPREKIVEVVKTVEKVVKVLPDNRVEAWFNGYDRARNTWSDHVRRVDSASVLMIMEDTYRKAGDAAVAAWDLDKAASGDVVKYPATCSHCNAPIAPLPSDKT